MLHNAATGVAVLATAVAIPHTPPGSEEDEDKTNEHGQGGGSVGGNVPVVEVGHTAMARAVHWL